MAKYAPMTTAEFAALRNSIGNQLEVAEAMETDRRTLGRWERGERPIPGVAAVCIRLLADQAKLAKIATIQAVREMEEAGE